jgi:hypothetical protein
MDRIRDHSLPTGPLFMKRLGVTWLRSGALFLACTSMAWAWVLPAAAAEKDAEKIVFQGSMPLPDRARDAAGNEVEITGLSGVAWLGDDRYVAVLDNSRYLLLFRLSLSQTGKPLAVESLEAVKLSQRHDYEDVVPCPAPVARGIERERWRGRPESRDVDRRDDAEFVLVCEEDTPAIRAFSLPDGGMVGAVPLPDNLMTRRPNRGLESLAIEPDGRSLWTANEEALPADGPPAAADAGTVVRLTRLPLPADGQDARERPVPADEAEAVAALQVAYQVDPVHTFLRVLSGQPLSGLSALVALGKGHLLTLERSGAPGLPPFASRIYLVDTASAVDVSGVERDLASRPEAFVKKRLLWKDSLGINLEGLCLGPRLADGSRGLVGIADNGGISTPNQLVGLSLVTPAPAVEPGVLGAVAALVAIALVVGRLTSP